MRRFTRRGLGFGIIYRSDGLVSRGVRDPRAVALRDHLVAPTSAPVRERFGFSQIGGAP